jgi:hypothetical protein
VKDVLCAFIGFIVCSVILYGCATTSTNTTPTMANVTITDSNGVVTEYDNQTIPVVVHFQVRINDAKGNRTYNEAFPNGVYVNGEVVNTPGVL